MRALVVLLLTLSLAAAGFVPASAQDGGPSKCLSQSHECEAARLAVSFVKRLHETDDAGPLVEEFFAPDFAERVQKFLRAGNLSEEHDFIFAIVSRDALTGAEPSDLRRTFVVLLNLWHQLSEFHRAVYDVTEARHNLTSLLADDPDGQLTRRVQMDALPPAIFEILKSDPLLALVKTGLEGESLDADDAEDESDDEAALLAELRAASIRSVERLRTLTEKLERCVALMRAATVKLREELKAHPERLRERTIELDDVYRVETKTFGTETLGFPAGTPFFHARLYPYVVVAVRVEGRLKVIGVLPDFDGD